MEIHIYMVCACRFLQRQDKQSRLMFARRHPAQPTLSHSLHESGPYASRCSVPIHVAAVPETPLQVGPLPSSTQPLATMNSALTYYNSWISTSTPFYDNFDRQPAHHSAPPAPLHRPHHPFTKALRSHSGHHISIVIKKITLYFNPFRTAVPFWGQTTRNLSGLSPKRDCGSKRVNQYQVLR